MEDSELAHILGLFQQPDDQDQGAQAVAKDKASVCAFCGRGAVVFHEGDFVCQHCGSLAHRVIDTHAEWRLFGGGDASSGRTGANMMRCGLPVNDMLPESSLGSLIGHCTGSCSREVRMMRRYHLWSSMSYKERTLYSIFEGMTVSSTNHGIPRSILEEAKALYKQVRDQKKITRGNNRAGLIAASVYTACKNSKVPRSTKEVAAIFGLDCPTMTRCCKRFQEMLHVAPVTTTAADFVSRYCSHLSLDRSRRDVVRRIVDTVVQEDLVSECTPPSIAVASIFMCSNVLQWGINKKELAQACDISQVTITKCYKKLLACQEQLFPQTQP